MESMDPGQLSIALYSVCKITNLNAESPSVWTLDFSFFTQNHVCLHSFVLGSSRFWWLMIAEDGFNHRYKHKRLMRIC